MSIGRGCRMLGYSKQAYFKATKNEKIKKETNVVVVSFILKKVEQIRRDMPKIGGRKLYFLIKPQLKEKGYKIGRDLFFEVLKEHNLLIKRKKRRYVTTDSSDWRRQFDNLIKGVLPYRPEQIWVADITYFVTEKEGHVHGHFLTDAYSKKIMGFEVSVDMKARSTLNALEMGLNNRMYDEELIHHSDRGTQYCSSEYVSVLKKNNILISMTQDGSPYDNAIAERINRIMKEEFLLGRTYREVNEVKRLTTRAVEIYNNYRPHWSNYLLTPNEMHLQKNAPIKTWSKIYDDEQNF